MQVVINIKAGDNMGKACTSRATGDHSAAIYCFSLCIQLFTETQLCQYFSLESFKKNDLAPSLDFAKSREERGKDKSL